MITRKQAMQWWNGLSSLSKTKICDTNTELVGSIRRWETLTGREIEIIYNDRNRYQFAYQFAAAVIIKNKKSEILFLMRNHNPFGYGLPGGKVEDTDESILDTGVRELFEETGIAIDKSNLSYYKQEMSAGNILVDIFNCDIIVEEKDIILSTEHSSFIFTKYPETITLAGNTKKFIS